VSPASSPRARVIGGVALVAVAAALVIGLVLTKRPNYPGAAAGPHPGAEPDVITPTRFSSDQPPALSLEAPPGWQLTYDQNTGKLEAIGKGALQIKTAILPGSVDPAAIVKEAVDLWVSSGGTVEGTFNGSIDGLNALATSVRFAAHSAVVWVVKRGDRLVTTMVCKAEGLEAREACRAVIATLRWRAPATP
jgi:hypothetical protein